VSAELSKIGKGGVIPYVTELFESTTGTADLTKQVAELRGLTQKRMLKTRYDLGSKFISNGSCTVEVGDWLLGTYNTYQYDKPGGLVVIRGHETKEKPLRWMWKPYLPLGKLVHFSGESSQAKSPVTVDIAARISTGAEFP